MTSRPTNPSRPRRGETASKQGETQEPVPRMPHERDESADQQGAHEPSMRRMGQLAQADTERGVADTSRGAETDATYHRLREDAPQPPAPHVPRAPARPRKPLRP